MHADNKQYVHSAFGVFPNTLEKIHTYTTNDYFWKTNKARHTDQLYNVTNPIV